MKFSAANLAALAAMATLVPAAMAAPIETCAQQADCVHFSAHKVDTNDCNCDCFYNICMTLTFESELCIKDDDDAVSHTCEKDAGVCSDNGGFAGTTLIETIEQGYMSCQKVPGGGVAEFLLKDGQAASGCGTASLDFQSTFSAECETFAPDVSQYKDGTCTGNGNANKECVWRVQAPSCNQIGGCFGDPHIKRFGQQFVDFHGECDLVLLHLDAVNQDGPLDLHIRTTIRGHYSFIEEAALAVGTSIMQVDTEKLILNGIQVMDEDLPLSVDEFDIQAIKKQGAAKIYTIVLSDKSLIKFKVIKTFLSVAVSGHEDDFADSVGLLGDFYTGQALGRDGRVMDIDDDWIAYGMEWQVQPDEPKLFAESREPQLPMARCVMPTESAIAARLLRSVTDTELNAQAERVCAVKQEYHACMEDVLATGDVDIAEAW